MRALLTTHRGAGHFGPLVPFAHALRRAGHDVLVAAPRSAGPMVARAGLGFHPVEEADPADEAPIYERVRSASPDGANELMLRDLFGRIRGGAALPAMLEAVAGWGPDLVLHEISELAGPAAAARYSVHVERWVPQADVMPHAAAMVGHGGSGSTLMAMAAGVPMAVVPFFADQPYNARRIAQIGAGVALEGGVEAVAEMPRAIRTLLEEPRYLRQARRVAAEVAALPPVDDAVLLLEDYAEGRALAA
jgi:UDP:flavonoid glycosyltransferase YjiC (YdhE family)